ERRRAPLSGARTMSRVLAGGVLILLALVAGDVPPVAPPGRPGPPPRGPPPPPPVTPLPLGPPRRPPLPRLRPPAGLPRRGGLPLEQAYSPWTPGQAPALVAAVEAVRGRHRVPLVGLEPWPATWAGRSAATLLADVAAGRYDADIGRACGALGAQAPQPVLV